MKNHGSHKKERDVGRMGSYLLAEIRSMLPEDRVETMNKAQIKDIQLMLMNNYLNGYSSKLALTGTVKIDPQEFK